MKAIIASKITITTVITVLALTSSLAQTIEERRAIARQRAEEQIRYLKDTLASAEAEEARRIEARVNRPRDPAATQRTAQADAEARHAWISREIVQWLHHDERRPDGSPAGRSDRRAVEGSHLRSLAESLAIKTDRDRIAVEQYLTARRLPKITVLPDGRITIIVGIEHGIPRALIAHNVEAADTVGTDELWPGGDTGLELTGTNIIIGLWDIGNVYGHGELGFDTPGGPRVTDMDGGLAPFWHTTHIAGTLIASGECTECGSSTNDTVLARGMAYHSRLLSWDFDSDTAEMAGTLTTNALYLSNHSYGNQAGWGILASSTWFGDIAISTNQDFHFGFYSGVAQTADQIANAAPTYLPVWSAANERLVAPGFGDPLTSPGLGYTTYSNGVEITSYAPRPSDYENDGGYDTLSEQACAKNILTVGGVHPITNGYAGSTSVVMAYFSSFGPTDDGRIKPDLVADGIDVFSLGLSGLDYDYMSGTSMATPNVCGSLALMLELHSRLDGTNQPMLASTLKGLAIHTADEAGNHPGPDYRFGWGLLNARKAAFLVTSNYYSGSLAHIKEVRLTGGDHMEFPIISAGTQTLVVTVQWNDPAGTPPPLSLDPTNHLLVNDLDLRVISPSGATNFPWVLNPLTHTNAATTADNFRDNVEQITITNPTAGTYIVRVTHKGTNLVAGTAGATNEQWVSIFVSGNIPQPPPALTITSITALNSNLVALTWPSVVGRVYQVQHRANITSGAWSATTAEISATKTNVAVALSVPGGVTSRFYRVAQLR